MKQLQVKICIMYAIDVDDNLDFTDDAEIQEIVGHYLDDNNMTAENEFFENIEVVCSNCGISLNLDEEKKQGKCASCEK